MDISSWLNKPYPFVENPKDKWILIIFSSSFVALFLIIFQPFDANKISDYKTLYLIGFGLNVFIALIICYFILPKVFQKIYDVENWVIGREIIQLTLVILIISFLNYIYNNYVGKHIAVPKTFFEFFGITFSIGVFPLTFLTLYIEQKLNRKNRENAYNLNTYISQKHEYAVSKLIEIQPETSTTKPIQIQDKDFLFANSDNNYCTIYYLEKNQVKKELLRISLKNLKEQLSDFDNMIRCHRSYIVNKNNIQNISGNARSLTLSLKNTNAVIPVSRRFPKEKLL